MEYAIEIQNLNKNFGEVQAVKDLSFKVKKGDLFAFLGVNGAGKSTTISIICGVLQKTSGEVFVQGKNVESEFSEISKTIGVVFQNSVLDGALSVEDNLMSRACLYGIYDDEAKNRIKQLAKDLDFEDLRGRTVGKLSGGQRRRIDIARALIHKPSILILDEPTTGLDPQTRKLLWRVIEKCQEEEKMTVLLTTHYMEETATADHVVIIDGGKIVAEGSPNALKNKYTGDFVTIYGVSEEMVKVLKKPYIKNGDSYKIEVKNTAEARDLILGNPEVFEDFEIAKGNMDDVFLSVTGKNLGGEKNENI